MRDLKLSWYTNATIKLRIVCKLLIEVGL